MIGHVGKGMRINGFQRRGRKWREESLNDHISEVLVPKVDAMPLGDVKSGVKDNVLFGVKSHPGQNGNTLVSRK